MAHDGIRSLPGQSEAYASITAKQKRLAELADKLMDQFSKDDLADPRLCALAAGLTGIYMLSMSQPSLVDQDRYFEILRKECLMSADQQVDSGPGGKAAVPHVSDQMN